MNYFLIIFIPSLLYFIDETFAKNKGVFKKIGIAFLIIMSSLRYEFGADYRTYYDAFTRIKYGIFTDAFEPGYIALNKIVAFFDLHFNFVLFIIAIFNLTLIYLSIEENVKKYKWIAMFFYLVYFDLFFYSLSAVRQSIVVSIFLFSIKYIKQKKFAKYFMWLLFGSLFHKTSIFLIIFYFMYQKLSKLNFINLSIIMMIITLGYSSISKILLILRPYMGSKLNYYLFIDKNYDGNNFIVALIVEVLMIAWIYISINMKNKEKLDDKIDISMFAVILFLALKVMQNIEYYSILPRMQMYFYSFLIFAIPKCIENYTKKSRLIAIYSFVCIMSFMFISRYNELMSYASQFYEKFKLIIF